jgi:hypothetical protein
MHAMSIVSDAGLRLTKDQIANLPSWCEELYSEIKSELIKLEGT